MACQSKTYINDLGSAVVAEVTSQLNRASAQTPLSLLAYPSAAAGTDAGAAAGVVITQTADEGSGILFTAHEDCFVTSIKMMTIGAAFSAAAPATSGLCILQVPSAWTNAADLPATQLVGVGLIHGNTAGIDLGEAPCTYTLRYYSDGTNFTALNGADDGQLFDLSSIVVAGASAISEFAGTILAVAHGATAAVALPAAGFNMNAGDSLVMGVSNATGATISIMTSVAYRPVKDSLTLSPAQTVTAFSQVAR